MFYETRGTWYKKKLSEKFTLSTTYVCFTEADHTKYVTVIPVDQRMQHLQTPISIQLPGQTHPQAYHFLVPGMAPGYPGMAPPGYPSMYNPNQHVPLLTPMSGLDSPALSVGSVYSQAPLSPSMHSHHSHQGSMMNGSVGGTSHMSGRSGRKLPRFPANYMQSTDEEDPSPASRVNHPPSFVVSSPDEGGGGDKLKIPANFMTSGTESDTESDRARASQAQLLSSKFAKMGGNG